MVSPEREVSFPLSPSRLSGASDKIDVYFDLKPEEESKTKANYRKKPKIGSKAWHREKQRQGEWIRGARRVLKELHALQRTERERLVRERLQVRYETALDRMRDRRESMSDIEFCLMHGPELSEKLPDNSIKVIQDRIQSGNASNADVIIAISHQLNQGDVEGAVSTRRFLSEPAENGLRPHTTHFERHPIDAVVPVELS